jgi:hypothetical protein
MRTRYLVAAAATLVVAAVAVTITLVSLEGPAPRNRAAPGLLVSDAPVLYRPGVRIGPAPQGFRVLRDPASYVDYAALFDAAGTGLGEDLRRLAGTSATGHLAFHRSTGCDSVSGPQLRAADGAYVLAFAGTVHHMECYAPAEALVVFVNPAS